MCGIAAIINSPTESRQEIETMVSVLRHRGPDSQGVYVDRHVALGHTRLRILDLDPRADQPMFTPDKGLAVVFNGEIYNYKELKRQLPDYPFTTTCDTEVILAAYGKWGTDCLAHFNGMFAFVLYDRRKNLIFGARDRFGIKPFYYTRVGDQLFIASEVKSLLTQTGTPTSNYSAICEYLLTGRAEHRRETFFLGIEQLLPGEAFLFEAGDLKRFRYYDLHEVMQEPNAMPEAQAAEKFRELLVSSVRYRIQSDVPVGVYFSGGLDSTVITGILTRILKLDGVRALTAVSRQAPEEQQQIVRSIAAQLQLDTELCHTDGNHVPSYFERLMWHMEMPFGLPNIIDDTLNRAAREKNLIVVLEGQGSDEAQAGYHHHYIAHLVDNFVSGSWRKWIHGLRHSPWPNRKSHPFTDFAKALVQRQRPKPMGAGKWQILSQYLSQPDDWLGGLRKEIAPPAYATELQRVLYRDVYTKLQKVLRYKDRMSMAYSRELRVPFLDHRVVEFTMSLPQGLKISNGVQKSLLRNAFADIIPGSAINLPKNVVLSERDRDPFKNRLQEHMQTLALSRTAADRGLFQVPRLQQDISRNALPGCVDIWRLGQVELWHQTFVDNNNYCGRRFTGFPDP